MNRGVDDYALLDVRCVHGCFEVVYCVQRLAVADARFGA